MSVETRSYENYKLHDEFTHFRFTTVVFKPLCKIHSFVTSSVVHNGLSTQSVSLFEGTWVVLSRQLALLGQVEVHKSASVRESR